MYLSNNINYQRHFSCNSFQILCHIISWTNTKLYSISILIDYFHNLIINFLSTQVQDGATLVQPHNLGNVQPGQVIQLPAGSTLQPGTIYRVNFTGMVGLILIDKRI